MASVEANKAGATKRGGFEKVMLSWHRWWRNDVVATVDQAEVIAKRRAECEITARYLLMVCMSAGIAILGLLLSSPAVVIGAMLLSPLMDPIMGVGFSLAIGDYRWLRRSARSLAVGSLFAVIFCAIVVFMSPLQTVTSEIAARTRPNLFDLVVALFSAIAGAYSMIRGREGTIVGVAIATALMPPLAVVGFGLATLNGTVFLGALFLFITNLTTIALTATVMARIYGFSTSLTDRGSQLQNFALGGAFVVLAVPLGISLQSIAWEANAQRIIRDGIDSSFAGSAESVEPQTTFGKDNVTVSATVYTNQLFDRADVESRAAKRLEQRLNRPVTVSILQIESASAREAELAQIGESRAREAESIATAEQIADRLALLAGVETNDVTVDRDRRRAMVRARPLDGASLAAYAELERRIDATEPEWDIRLIPPALAMPAITFEQIEAGGDDAVTAVRYQPDAAGKQAVALIAWAQSRIGIPVRLEGPADSVELARTVLAASGIAAATNPGRPGYGPVTARWSTQEG